MSLHKLSAGGGVDYLLRHTCRGDVDRAAQMPLSAYYVETGYPPGRWIGEGLAGVGAGRGIAGAVEDEAMTRLFAHGMDPVTGAALGANWRVCKTLEQRIAGRIEQLPTDVGAAERAELIDRIHVEEAARSTPIAVSGFDLTFTLPKSASVLWAPGRPDHANPYRARAHDRRQRLLGDTGAACAVHPRREERCRADRDARCVGRRVRPLGHPRR